jgi:hypothetical protein
METESNKKPEGFCVNQTNNRWFTVGPDKFAVKRVTARDGHVRNQLEMAAGGHILSIPSTWNDFK